MKPERARRFPITPVPKGKTIAQLLAEAAKKRQVVIQFPA